MSTHGFRPGDVVEHPEYGLGIVRERWGSNGSRIPFVFFVEGPGKNVSEVADDLKPCAVINPENDEQMGRFVDLVDAIWAGSNGTLAEALTEAAREYARPTPPVVKPPEPQGLGSVVLDGYDEWVLVDPSHPRPWKRENRAEYRAWHHFPDTVVITRGDDE